MSDLSKTPIFEYKHLLVFDTLALLSAKSNRVQVWRNNQQLGECYIPGGTYAEICNISQDKENSDFHVAKAFLKFVEQEKGYKIQRKEDNRHIPLDNEKDRQIIACAYKLAEENPNCVIILVTYDRTLKGLIGQSGLPNFCTLTAKDLSDWHSIDFYLGEVPQAVGDAYQRMKSLQSSPSGQNHKPANNFPKPQHQPQKNQHKQQRQSSQNSDRRKLKIPTHSKNHNQYPQNPSKPQKKSILNTVIIGLASAFASLIVIAGIKNFIVKDSATIVTQEVSGNQPVKQTPPQLISQAESSIIQFQNTKEPSILRQSLNELQTLKNQQALRLDKEGEQRLSRIKHKYAIEVLASSGQKAEAVKMLEEIPQSYSEYKNVKKSLLKLKT